MTVSRGIVYGGIVLPETERCLRDPAAWWDRGERGTRERTGPPDVLVGHWTASHPDTGPHAGPKTVRNMKARRRADGTPMQVGIGFVISWDGLIWQTADLAIATVHVGDAALNRRSVGVECDWPGTMQQAARLGAQGIAKARRIKLGRGIVHTMEPSPEMLESWVWLAETLARHLPIPRQVPLERSGELLLDRMTTRQARTWRGALEHLHVPDTTKIDAGGYLVGALRKAGWRGVHV